MLGTEDELAPVPARQHGSFGRHRHSAVERDHEEVHEDAEAGQPQAGAIAVEVDRRQQHHVGRQQEADGGVLGPAAVIGQELGGELDDERSHQQRPRHELDPGEVGQSSPSGERDGDGDGQNYTEQRHRQTVPVRVKGTPGTADR